MPAVTTDIARWAAVHSEVVVCQRPAMVEGDARANGAGILEVDVEMQLEMTFQAAFEQLATAVVADAHWRCMTNDYMLIEYFL